MTKAKNPPTSDDGQARPVFISHATADRKEALAVCKAIERRGIRAWVAGRDVRPGENYQEAIVRAIRGARAMILVFSGAANNSDEIKKELSLASKHHVPLMALRMEDVEPSDAFAYELSTRQWIDAFDGWDKSIDSLARRIREISRSNDSSPPAKARSAGQRDGVASRRSFAAVAAAALLLALGGVAWWFLRPAPAVAHSMMVRLSGFQRLSTDLPENLPDTVRDEITAAFGDQGFVGVSTAAAPPAGPAPAYALGGTIRRDGDQIRVITRLTNERSGATLWSSSSNYDAAQLARVPRRIAVDAARMARCGLFGASTYRKSLPDLVLSDYLQFCQTALVFQSAPQKGLDSARKVVAAVPDFSWGWSAVALAASQAQWANPPGPRREEVRQTGLQAADKALSLDSGNAEALAMKSMLADPNDRVTQENLLQQSIAARPLDCGCQHLLYGIVLENVGRFSDAAEEFRRAVDMLALDANSQFNLGDSLTVIGKPDEAKQYLEASNDLAADADWEASNAAFEAPDTGDYRAAIKGLEDPKMELPEGQRAAFLAGFRALISGDKVSKGKAAQMLVGLPAAQQDPWTVKLLGALGAHHEALRMLANRAGTRLDWPSMLWYPSTHGALYDPAFPAVAQRLGLMHYWKTSHTKPDVCSTNGPPPFCRMI